MTSVQSYCSTLAATRYKPDPELWPRCQPLTTRNSAVATQMHISSRWSHQIPGILGITNPLKTCSSLRGLPRRIWSLSVRWYEHTWGSTHKNEV